MSLAAGTRLGPYEVLAPIGAGGMGEVYRARDTRLGRDVAIKVLPGAFAQDADRLARFEREAKTIAALSHSNILAVFDTGREKDLVFLVTELLHGDTLRDRLKAGRLPVRKAIDIAIQIARGLAAAHDKGIVHRDLKPENVFLLADGQIKILDFGLAKPAAPRSGDATETAGPATDPGAVMGTVGYMAPEQVRGQATDARTDLFALGAVLYEMLAGRRAFQRDTAAQTMTAILEDDPPDLGGVRSDLPPALDRIVRHCLEKNPSERFGTAPDVAFALEALSGSQAPAAPHGVAPKRFGWATLTAGLLVIVTVAAYAVWTRSRTRDSSSTLVFDLKTLDPQFITNARFARDGTIVFSATKAGPHPQVYALRSGSVVPQPIGPPDTHLLSVSSRGDLLVIREGAFIGHRLFEGTLATMTPEGSVRLIQEHVKEADWAPDGKAMAVIRSENGIDRLEYPIGTVLCQSSGYFSEPRVSPDGTRVAFADHSLYNDDNGAVKIVDGSGKIVQQTEAFYAVEGMAWWHDGQSLLFSASPVGGGQQLLPYVVNVDGPPHARPAVPAAEWTYVHDAAPDGRLLLTREDLRLSNWAKRKTDTVDREYAWLSWSINGHLSGDGRVLVFSDEDQSAGGDYAVQLFHTDVVAAPVRLGDGTFMGLSPDGKLALAFLMSTKQLVLYPTGPGVSSKLDPTTVESYRFRSSNWSSDSSQFLFCGSEKSRPPRCYQQRIAGGPPAAISEEGVLDVRLGPDDRTILEKRASGEFVLGSLGDRATRPAKGLTPEDGPIAWSRDGKSVFVQVGTEVPKLIVRVDLATGTRTTVKQLAPPDRAGVMRVFAEQWLDDGAAYVYSTYRDLSRLFVASGFQVPPIK